MNYAFRALFSTSSHQGKQDNIVFVALDGGGNQFAVIKLQVSAELSHYVVSMQGHCLPVDFFDRIQVFCAQYVDIFYPTCNQDVYCSFVTHIPSLAQ